MKEIIAFWSCIFIPWKRPFFVSFITWTNKVMKEEEKMVEPQKESGHWGAIRQESIEDDSVRDDDVFFRNLKKRKKIDQTM